MTSCNVLCVLQARMSSTRLPGKVLMDLGGQPMLLFMIRRLARSSLIDQLVVATSMAPSDDALVEVLDAAGVKVFRGPLDDVLGRFAGAAATYAPQVVVRVTGDCPLIDPDLVDRVIAPVLDGQCDYASNTSPPTYPDGLDCEAFSYALLTEAAKEARLGSEREHVTPYMRNSANARLINVASPIDLSSLRWTVDYEDDLHRMRELVAGASNPLNCDRFDFLRVVEGSAKLFSQAEHARNEGYLISTQADGT